MKAMTGNYGAGHQNDLDGRRGVSRGWEPQAVRVLRVLDGAQGGLSEEAVADALREGITPRGITPRRRVLIDRYRRILRQLAAAGEAAADPRPGGRRAAIWRITDAGRRRIAAVAAAPDRANVLLDARRQFGPCTPAGIRRAAAPIMSGQGYLASEIARVFGVTSQTIRLGLRQAGPAAPGPDADRALGELAARAGEVRAVRQALDDVRGQFGRDAPGWVREEAAVILASAGMSAAEIGAVFGVTASPIGRDLRRYRSAGPEPAPAARLRGLARAAAARKRNTH